MEYPRVRVRPLLMRHVSCSLVLALGVTIASAASAQIPTELGPAGLGMVIGHVEGHLTVMRVLPEMSAGRAGLREGDRIVRIDGAPTRQLLLIEAGGRLRGEAGTEVTVWISRERKPGRWSRPRAYRVVRELLPEVPPHEL
jgi:C-terminal processing protease CtpA/Prc